MSNSLTHSDVEWVRSLLHRRAGVFLTPDKSYLIDSRLNALAMSMGESSSAKLLQRMREKTTPDMERLVVEAMVTHETTFFRDIHPFQALKDHLLPDFIRKRADQKSLNIWCAACSTGQEPYSVAMLLQEHFPFLLDWKVTLLATDVSLAALERAKQGVFSQLEVNRGLPAAYLTKYFDQISSERWQVREKVRKWVVFQPVNLMAPWPLLPAMDVVFLRNVLIYFDLETRQTLLARIRRQLEKDGVLFLGGAETTCQIDDAFAIDNRGPSVFFRPRA